MPYRRLPNTDLSRIKALKTAIEKAAGTDFQDVAISMKTLSRARSVVEKFERLSLKYQQTLDTQVKANIAFQSKVKNARMYLSHFIQVLYMSVMRSEIKPEHLDLYGLQDTNFVVPDLSSNEQLLQWGQRIKKRLLVAGTAKKQIVLKKNGRIQLRLRIPGAFFVRGYPPFGGSVLDKIPYFCFTV